MSKFFDWVGSIAKDHTKMLTSVAAREGLSSEDALDAVQEAFYTFLGLPQARDLVNEKEDTSKLLTIVTRNVARNMRRRHFRSRAHSPIENQELAMEEKSADELIQEAENHVKLLGCIKVLDALQKEVVTLRMLEEVAAPEVAKNLGVSTTHVGVLLHRAKKRIEQCLLH